MTTVALLGEHRHGTPPGGVLACQPSWHATCRHCRKPIALCFEAGGHPIWLHDNPHPGAPYSRCLPATYAEPMPVVTEAVAQQTPGSVVCPWCGATGTDSCRGSDGQLRVPHRARQRMAQAASR